MNILKIVINMAKLLPREAVPIYIHVTYVCNCFPHWRLPFKKWNKQKFVYVLIENIILYFIDY